MIKINKALWGCREDIIDRRDKSYEDFIAGKGRPVGMPTFEQGYDVEEEHGKNRDDYQHESLRCVAQGGTCDEETSIFIRIGKRIHLSIRDAYSQIFQKGGGASPRDFYKLAYKKGICEERYCPSYPADGSRVTEAFSRKRGHITQERIDNALKWRIGPYRSITSMDMEVMAQAIFENDGCGGAYKPIDAGMGHMIFFKGYGIHKGYFGLRYRDSYDPFDKWIVKHKGRFYYSSINHPLAVQIKLYSIWTAEPNRSWDKNMSKKKVDLRELNIISNELLFRDADKDLQEAYLGKDGEGIYDQYFVRGEIGKSIERWRYVRIINWSRKWKVVNLISGEREEEKNN